MCKISMKNQDIYVLIKNNQENNHYTISIYKKFLTHFLSSLKILETDLLKQI